MTHAAAMPNLRARSRSACGSLLTAIEMNAGQRPQPFHADDGSITLPRPHIALECIAIWALTDFTAANGGTRIVPGSHKWDRSPVPGEQVEYVTVEMPAGRTGWLPAQEHRGVNIGDTETHTVFVELKEPAPGGSEQPTRIGPAD